MATKGGGRAILGFGFMAVGATFVWGGLTGRLAPMLAALFAPDDLAAGGSGGGQLLPPVPGTVIEGPGAGSGSYTGPGVNPYPGVPSSPTNPYGYVSGG